MARKKKAPTLPGTDDERELLNLMDAVPDSVTIRGVRMKIPMLNGHAQRKITRIMLRQKDDELSISCKCLAAARLNGYFKIKFLWSLLWRWYYYIRQYSEDELSEAAALIKKKVPLTAYLVNTTLWIEMRETTMQMNREEVSRILQGQYGGRDGKSVKSDNGSPSPSAS